VFPEEMMIVAPYGHAPIARASEVNGANVYVPAYCAGSTPGPRRRSRRPASRGKTPSRGSCPGSGLEGLPVFPEEMMIVAPYGHAPIARASEVNGANAGGAGGEGEMNFRVTLIKVGQGGGDPHRRGALQRTERFVDGPLVHPGLEGLPVFPEEMMIVAPYGHAPIAR
jgi:hypothetical protein